MIIRCSKGLWCQFDVQQKGDLKKKTYSGKKEPSRWLCCFRNAIYPQTMLAHLRFPLCRKQLTEYKKRSGVKGCLVACFIAEGRVKPFKVHSFVNENIFCKATAHRIWNMMPFVNSPSGMMRRKRISHWICNRGCKNYFVFLWESLNIWANIILPTDV